LFGEIPDDPGDSSPNNNLFHPIMIRHFIQKCKVTIRDQRCPEMIFIDPVDECNVCRKCRTGIARGGYRDLPGLFPARTAGCKNRCVALITPA
jgi:hypothetical protein